uniref:RING-type E3 ubiquitin transferase n=1 Tax=Zea mays TaxID=4577 RepID=B4FB15_MAIZE|nr:unknown [Zea mays]
MPPETKTLPQRREAQVEQDFFSIPLSSIAIASMASSSIHIHHPRLAGDEIHRTLEASYSPSASYCSDDAFVPVFRPDPSAPSVSASASADRVRSLFRSVDVALFRDTLFAPGRGGDGDGDDLGFTDADAEAAEYDGDLTSIFWDCLQIEDADDPLAASPAEEFEWEEVASPSGAAGEAPEPEWEVLADVPPAAAEEGFVYTSHHRGRDEEEEEAAAYEVLVAGGEGLLLKTKPPAARSAVEALPSAVVAAGQEGQGDECAVCKDGVAVGQRVKRLPCSHRYHDGCIVPWLQVRNSCPLCRFELPTDDPEYESWKAGRTDAA